MHRETAYLSLPKEPKQSPSWIGIGILFLIPPMTPIACLLVVKRLYALYKRERLRSLRQYLPLINGGHRSLRIKIIAASLGKSPAAVRSDIRDMLAKGYLVGPAYIDPNTDSLILTADLGDTVYTDFAEAQPRREEPQKAPESEKQSRPEPEPPKSDKAQKKPVQTANDVDIEQVLRRLKELNDDIEHEGVSRRIDRIGSLTANILQRGQASGRDAEMRKFMSYYLPTTLKLLESYALLEDQSYQGANIMTARADIERILDTVIKGFEEQLDRLFSGDALDISSDISVLEQMLASDGLAGGLRMESVKKP